MNENERMVYRALFTSKQPMLGSKLANYTDLNPGEVSSCLNALTKRNKVLPIDDTGEQRYTPACLAAVRASLKKPDERVAQFVLSNCEPYIPKQLNAETLDLEVLLFSYARRLNTMLIGETGTGKTASVRWVAYLLGVPYMRINLNGGTTAEDFIGQFVAKDSEIAWSDGMLTLFMRAGGILVCDELNAAPADINMILNPVLDDERRLVLVQRDSEVLHSHPDFWFVSTLNPDGDYEGTKPLNHALRDRFPIILNFNYDPVVESRILTDPGLVELLYKLRHSDAINTKVSTRTGKQFASNRAIFGVDTALELFINRFTIDEQPVVRELAKILVEPANVHPTA
jgi:hypothetical protein